MITEKHPDYKTLTWADVWIDEICADGVHLPAPELYNPPKSTLASSVLEWMHKDYPEDEYVMSAEIKGRRCVVAYTEH